MSMIGELEKLLAMDNWRPNLNGINYTNSEGQCPDKHFLCHQKHSDHLLNTIRSEFRMFAKHCFFLKETKNTIFVVQRTTLHDEEIEDYKENNYT